MGSSKGQGSSKVAKDKGSSKGSNKDKGSSKGSSQDKGSSMVAKDLVAGSSTVVTLSKTVVIKAVFLKRWSAARSAARWLAKRWSAARENLSPDFWCCGLCTCMAGSCSSFHACATQV